MRDSRSAVGAAILSMISVQGGASFAKKLFPLIGTTAATALRVGFAAVLLLIIHRPKPWKFTAKQWFYTATYGISMASMNLLFYVSIERIPLGLAVTVEFLGPLFLAFAFSKRISDVFWAVLALFGVFLITPFGISGIDTVGLVFALCAGVFWALYILLGRKIGSFMDTSDAIAVGMTIGTLFVLPFVFFSDMGFYFDSTILWYGLGVAIFSGALPYSLDLFALKAISSKTFSVLTSLQPAFGALAGFIFLQELLSLTQWLAILCVVAASVGSTSMNASEKQVI